MSKTFGKFISSKIIWEAVRPMTNFGSEKVLEKFNDRITLCDVL